MKIRHLLIAVLSVSAFSSAQANGWCDSRPTPSERQSCYRSLSEVSDPGKLARGAVQRYRTNYGAIQQSQKIPKAEKDAFLARMDSIAKKVDATCKTDSCVSLNVSGLNNQMVAFYNRYHK